MIIIHREMAFVIPPSKLDTIKTVPMTSRVNELPLLSLGHHSCLIKAREKLASVAELPGMNDILKVLHSYHMDGEDVNILELNETLQEAFYLHKGKEALPKTATMVGDEGKLPFLVSHLPGKLKIKVLPPNVKSLMSKLKKGEKKTDLFVVTGVEDPVTALVIGLSAGSNNVCVKLSDYPLTQTLLALLSIYSHCFESVSLYRPLVVSPFQARATVFVIAKGMKGDVFSDIQPLIDKVSTATEKEYVVNTFSDLTVPSETKAAVLSSNIKMIARDVCLIEDLYK